MNTSNPALVKVALDAGLHFLDTAQGYQRGTNESMIGEVLKGRPRDSFAIATKAGMPKQQTTGLYGEDVTEEAYAKKIDVSLKSLGLDHVEVYHHHGVWVREAALYEPILNALTKAKQAGKVRFIGVTTHRNEPEVLQAAIDSKVYDVVAVAYNFRQKHVAEMKAAIAKTAAAGLGVVAMKTIGGNVGGAYHNQQIDAPAALKWALQDPNVHTIIAGFTTFDQFETDLAVLRDPAMTKAEVEYLHRVAQTPGLYCQGCGGCVGKCVSRLPIPDLMRAYMYVHGYGNQSAAQEAVGALQLPMNPCGDCAACPVVCQNGWRVAERVRDIVRVRDTSLPLVG
jgi:predicted aldo/keto reductase-like oxidoreductase